MLECVLSVHGDADHTHQLIAGFILLHRRGEIDLDIRWRSTELPVPPSTAIVAGRIGGTPVGFDMDDGEVVDPTRLDAFADRTALLFRRSMTTSPNGSPTGPYATRDKHRPLGLNYHATALHPDFLRIAVRGHDSAAARLRAASYALRDHYRRFEARPDQFLDGTVVFFARLWDPQGESFETLEADERTVERRTAMNRVRVEVIRRCRRDLGDAFVGGLSDTPYARTHHPELVVPRKQTASLPYIRAMKTGAVCVANRGLHESNGWKLTEYVAASRSVVTERPRHLVPDFHEGEHYLGYDSEDECVENIARLLADRTKRDEIARANRDYYLSHVRPDALVRRSLAVIRSEVG